MLTMHTEGTTCDQLSAVESSYMETVELHSYPFIAKFAKTIQ